MEMEITRILPRKNENEEGKKIEISEFM